jgi:beta-glucosidase
MTFKTNLILGLLIVVGLNACVTAPSDDHTLKQSGNLSFDYGQDVEDLIAGMTIEEKVGQMTQINIDVISKGEIFNLEEPHELDSIKLDSAINYYYVGSVLNVGGHTYTRQHWSEIITAIQEKAIHEGNGIPIIYGIDAIHGVNYTVGATLFPQEIGQAATWNPLLVEQGAAITAYECRASGIPWNFSPVLDLARTPLWSRFFETYGEDVYLAKTMSAACISGYQGNDASDPEKVAACMKHFLGYSMPLSGKDRTPAWIPERQIREYFLPTFQTAIDHGALTVMINSGEINGIPVHADPDILTTLLREELGFKGLVVTDWEDIIKLHRDHKVAKDMDDAVKISVMAGIDMSMTPNDYSFNRSLIKLVKQGEVPESRLDESCRRILWVKKQLGLLQNPVPDFADYDLFGSESHSSAALNTVLESMTLLKNEGNLLPLDSTANILVCGPAAHSLNVLNGAWTHTWQGLDETYNTQGASTIYEAVVEYSTGSVDYALGADLEEVHDIDQALKKGRSADVILVCLGEVPCTEKPGDIEDLNLPEAQKELVKQLSKLNKPMVFALVFNRPRVISDIEPCADAIINCYLPGDFGGDALASILFGETNPSGKLPFTYPRYTGSLVPYDHKYTETLDKSFGRDAFNPQWKFGFGLSYSQFEYSNLAINDGILSATDTLVVSVELSNISKRDGLEVVQVFVTDEVATITPSVKRLRAYDKVMVPAGESIVVELELPISELAFVNTANEWVVEPGSFTLLVGTETLQFTVR